MAVGGRTNISVCEEAGITEATLYRWLKDPMFCKLIVDRAREILKARIPDLYHVGAGHAEDGSAAHLKIILDHIDKLEERASATKEASITFRWTTDKDEEKDE